jgi:hypothetical protein
MNAELVKLVLSAVYIGNTKKRPINRFIIAQTSLVINASNKHFWKGKSRLLMLLYSTQFLLTTSVCMHTCMQLT